MQLRQSITSQKVDQKYVLGTFRHMKDVKYRAKFDKDKVKIPMCGRYQ